MYCPLFKFCFFMAVNTHKQTEKQSINKNQCNLGSRMIKFKNAGLWAPQKISLGSGLHSQKRIRAPVSKMIGLRAPKQKFQGSRAPGTPPLRPCRSSPVLKRARKAFGTKGKDTNIPILLEILRKLDFLIR